MVSTEPMLPVLTAQIPETLDVLPGVGELIIGIEPSLTFLLQRVSPEVALSRCDPRSRRHGSYRGTADQMWFYRVG
jgi:thymidylate kinase